jgi:protein-disulfide isomerase
MIGFSRAGGNAAPPRQVFEAFLDFHCPFSNKLFGTVTSILDEFPNLEFRVVVHLQPWHPQATFMSLVVLATHMVAPARTFDLMHALYKHQSEYSDQECHEQSPRQLFEKLFALAKSVGVDEAALRNQLSPDLRERVVAELKRHTKYSRQNGIHVSPTVMVNGLVNNEVSSGWSQDQFRAMLGKL